MYLLPLYFGSVSFGARTLPQSALCLRFFFHVTFHASCNTAYVILMLFTLQRERKIPYGPVRVYRQFAFFLRL